MSRFTNSLLRFAALFFFIGLAVGTARADDFYAAPGATGTGLSAASPDELCDVVALSNANAAVDTIYLLVPQNGGVETFFEDLVSTDGCPIMDGGFAVDVIFDTFEEDTFTEGISGTVAIDGDYALVGVAAQVSLDEAGRCRQAKVAMLSVGEGPVEAPNAARVLTGEAPTPEAVRAASEAAANEDIDPPDDIHASPAYRRHLARVLTHRALTEAFARAKDL